jgi:hypothetical protein
MREHVGVSYIQGHYNYINVDHMMSRTEKSILVTHFYSNFGHIKLMGFGNGAGSLQKAIIRSSRTVCVLLA